MELCLNCGGIIKKQEKKRSKKFCNSTCRSNYWQKKNKLEKLGFGMPVVIPVAKKRISPKVNKVTDLTKQSSGTTQNLTEEKPKTNHSINTEKIAELEKELAAIPDKTKGIGKLLARSLQEKIYKLKYQQ